jgi:hypothetical protein
MTQGGQLPPNLLATKPMVARPINTAPIKIAHSFMWHLFSFLNQDGSEAASEQPHSAAAEVTLD